MATAENPLASLDDDELEALAELAKAKANGGLSRRQLLQAAGYTGVGALLGSGALAASGDAKAATGQWGVGGNPLTRVKTENLDGDGNAISVGDTLDPDADSTHDLGSTGNIWKKLFLSTIGGDGSAISVDDNLDFQSSQDLQNVNLLTTEGLDINGEYLWASAYDGADADTRLDNAISDSDTGDTIFLEAATYTSDRTISKELKLQGPSYGTNGANIQAAWTLGKNTLTVQFAYVDSGNGGSITVNSGFCVLNHINSNGASITVSGDRGKITDCDNLSVTFESGTSDGLVDSSTSMSVTDNGSNTVGDTT